MSFSDQPYPGGTRTPISQQQFQAQISGGPTSPPGTSQALQSKYTKDRVHSLDKQPKTGSHKGRIVAIVLICILVVCGIILMWMGFVQKDALIACATTESPTCYMLTCPSLQTETCKEYAYRCSAPGMVRCSSNPSVDVPIASGDDICKGTS